jgi:hypothetical protein
MRQSLAVAAVLALAASRAAADEFNLANGRKIEGIERPDPARPGKIVIEVGAGVIELDTRDVVSKSPGRTVLHEYYERWDRVKDSKKAGEYYRLARWARENGCHKFVAPLCEKAIEINPDHAGAREMLGYRKADGKWLTFEESQAARGLVLFEGRWVTVAERELTEQSRLEARARAEAARLERERRAEEARLRREEAAREYGEWMAARYPELPYGYMVQPSEFWPAYYRPYPWVPYMYKRPPGGGCDSYGGGCGAGLILPFLPRAMPVLR